KDCPLFQPKELSFTATDIVGNFTLIYIENPYPQTRTKKKTRQKQHNILLLFDKILSLHHQ
ncbi:hypothetical protein, partial [Prevotella melaninogenica]|uniref:hypothetical protein n=1 Tax=Prevotella melaninogenica TaxID=28132 RepID=UPI001E2856F9